MNIREFDERLRTHADCVKSHLTPPGIDLETITAEKECTDLKFKKKYISFIAAAAIVALLGTVALGEAFGWNIAMLEYFRLTPDQTEILDSATAFPQATATDNGVTITVRQTLADSHGLYVLYDIEAPEGFEFTDDIQFGASAFDPDSEALDGAYHSSAWTSQTLYQSGNRRTAMLCYNTDGSLKSGQLKFVAKHLGYINRDYAWPEEPATAETNYTREKDPVVRRITPDFLPLIEGRWELCWDFEYENVAETIEVNKPVHFDNGEELTLKKIELSPISIWVELEQYTASTITDSFNPPKPVITLRDGTTVKLTYRNGGYGGSYSAFIDRPGGIYTSPWNFEDGVIDTASVASITVGDLTVKIE